MTTTSDQRLSNSKECIDSKENIGERERKKYAKHQRPRSNVFSADEKTQIVEYCKQNPDASIADVCAYVRTTVSKFSVTSLSRVLKNNGVILKRRRQRESLAEAIAVPAAPVPTVVDSLVDSAAPVSTVVDSLETTAPVSTVIDSLQTAAPVSTVVDSLETIAPVSTVIDSLQTAAPVSTVVDSLQTLSDDMIITYVKQNEGQRISFYLQYFQKFDAFLNPRTLAYRFKRLSIKLCGHMYFLGEISKQTDRWIEYLNSQRPEVMQTIISNERVCLHVCFYCKYTKMVYRKRQTVQISDVEECKVYLENVWESQRTACLQVCTEKFNRQEQKRNAHHRVHENVKKSCKQAWKKSGESREKTQEMRENHVTEGNVVNDLQEVNVEEGGEIRENELEGVNVGGGNPVGGGGESRENELEGVNEGPRDRWKE